MKKIFTIICILALSVALHGCGSSKGITQKNYEKIDITKNMTYKQVSDILGSEGKIIEEDKEEKTQKYLWEDPKTKAQIRVTFEEDIAAQASYAKGND